MEMHFSKRETCYWDFKDRSGLFTIFSSEGFSGFCCTVDGK